MSTDTVTKKKVKPKIRAIVTREIAGKPIDCGYDLVRAIGVEICHTKLGVLVPKPDDPHVFPGVKAANAAIRRTEHAALVVSGKLPPSTPVGGAAPNPTGSSMVDDHPRFYPLLRGGAFSVRTFIQ